MHMFRHDNVRPNVKTVSRPCPIESIHKQGTRIVRDKQLLLMKAGERQRVGVANIIEASGGLWVEGHGGSIHASLLASKQCHPERN